MKKVFCLALILALLCGCAPVLAAEETILVVCDEEEFSTRIPAGMSAAYEQGIGLQISVGTPGYVPYVVVSRRPLDMKLKNPTNYLNNVYREFMENKYGSDMVGTNPCREYEIGGKTLLGARYIYKVGQNTLCLLLLIEVRDDGDVEYSAKYVEGDDSATMTAMDTAIRYYKTGEAEEAPNASGLVDVTCAEKGFSTKIPEDAQAGWEEADGIFYIWLGDYGYVPNVYIVRRDKKLNDPVNYVHNVYTNYMKETNGDRLVGTSLYEYYEVGGKRLVAASYLYKASSGAIINQMYLVEVRDDGDVEYCVRFLNSERDMALEALDAAVRYYHTNDSANTGKTGGSLQLNAAPAQPIVSKTVEYKDGRFHVTLPVGWNIMTQSEYMTFCFRCWDPQSPNRAVFLFMKLEPFLKSDAAKAWYKDKSGGRLDNIYSLTAEAPVMQTCTLQGFLDAIPDAKVYCKTFYDAGVTIHPDVLPEMTSVSIIERNKSTLPAPPDCKENIIARIAYQDFQGQACEGLVTAQPRDSMQYIWDGIDTWQYTVSLFMGVTAPVGELVELEPILVECLSSFAFEESYVNQAIQVSIDTKEQLQAQMRQMEAAHDAMMDAWYAREQSHDISFQKLSDSIMGYDRLYDSSTGEVYLADVGFYDTYDLHRYEYSNSNLQLVDNSTQQYYLQGADYYITH